jgi:hypothetical protein
LFTCGKALEVFWVFGEFLDKVGLTGFPYLREAKSNRRGLTGFRNREGPKQRTREGGSEWEQIKILFKNSAYETDFTRAPPHASLAKFT